VDAWDGGEQFFLEPVGMIKIINPAAFYVSVAIFSWLVLTSELWLYNRTK